MSKEIIVGLDAGTSLIKFVAFDKYGKFIDSASVKNKVYYREGGKAEQNLEETWKKVIEAFKLLSNKIDRLSEKLEAICITGQGDGSWPIDKEGTPVGDAALWLDGRSGDIIDKWRNSEIFFKEKNILEIKIVEKFVGERGRINCSLKENNGFWRWLGVQFVIGKS